jgi:hypothetical protein
MAETPADVRRDIELTRNRISDTLQELEHKMNVTQIVRDNPWPALALAVGAGVLLSGTKADVKAAAATALATRGASSRVGGVLDELVAQVVGGFQGEIESRIEGLANEVKKAIGAPSARSNGGPRAGSSFGGGTTAEVTAAVPRAD